MTKRSTLFCLFLLLTCFSANANHNDNKPVNVPPDAAFAIASPSGCVPHATEFIDYSSDNTTSWNWTFEGGTPATSTQQDPVINYNTPGEYLVTLIASNADGSDTATAQVQIYNMAPVADFNYEISGNTTTFTNQMTNTETHIWEFGDGNTSTEINPVHTYAEEGTYVARLKSSNNCTTDIYLEVVVIGGDYQPIGHNASTSWRNTATTFDSMNLNIMAILAFKETPCWLVFLQKKIEIQLITVPTFNLSCLQTCTATSGTMAKMALR